jgi:hypothetical protein
MVMKCSTHEKVEKYIKVLVGRPEGNRSLRRPKDG